MRQKWRQSIATDKKALIAVTVVKGDSFKNSMSFL